MVETPIKVLFVCYANICRSPMAQSVFKSLVERDGLADQIECDSAGVSYMEPGSPPHSKVLQCLHEHGLESSHSSRRIHTSDLQTCDYVLAVDSNVLRSIWGMGKGRAKVEPLMKYAPSSGYSEIPDPLGTNNFELVYDLVSTACDGLLASIRKTHEI